MKTKIFLLTFFLCFFSTKTFPQWTIHCKPGANIEMATPQVGFRPEYESYGSHGTTVYLKKTSDCWLTTTTSFSYTNELYSVGIGVPQFMNASTGAFILNDMGIFALYRTSSGGNGWSRYGFGCAVMVAGVNSFCVTSAQLTYMAASESGLAVVKSQQDLFQIVWRSRHYKVSPAIIKFINDSTGFLLVKNINSQSIILRTINYGVDWTSIDSSYNSLRDINFISPSTGFILADNGKILKTSDAGLSWVLLKDLSQYTPNTINSIWFLNDQDGYAVGNYGTILVTNDGGTNWERQCSPVLSNLIRVKGFDSNALIIITSDGYLLNNNGGSVSESCNQLCRVTCDSVSGKNLVIWNQYNGMNYAYTNIYKATTPWHFTRIGSVPFTSSNVYVDTSSNPGTKSDKYMISFTDSTGKESDTLGYHQTISLNVQRYQHTNQLTWTPYFGISVSQYQVYRKGSQTGWELIAVLSKSITNYADTIEESDEVKYLIAMPSPYICYSNSGYMSDNILSNIAGISHVGYEDPSWSGFRIFPNPVKDILTITKQNKNDDSFLVELVNPYGRIIMTKILFEASLSIDMRDFSNGLYFIRIQGKNGQLVRKIVKD